MRCGVAAVALLLALATGGGAAGAGTVPAPVQEAASPITIAVVDTGADVDAPAIAAKHPLTWNVRTQSTDVRDENGHGTFVASIAAAASGDAQLMIVAAGRADGSLTDVDEAAAIVYAVDHGARILNLSIGGATTSPTERGAVRYAVDHGALVVAAAGNEYAPNDPVEYPAALLQPVGSNGVGGAGLAVTASTASGKRAPFANTGSWISLAAPGEHVFGDVSALSSPLAYPRAHGGPYGYASGTSFAVPQVAGAAALVWAADRSLTAQQVAQILKETATGRGRWTPQLGFGVLDVPAAVARARSGRVGVLLGGTRDHGGVHLDWSGSADAYAVHVATDGGAPHTLVAATTRTTATVPLPAGHTYSFTVSALDPDGRSAATSAPLTLALR
jgi:hypothetical protein